MKFWTRFLAIVRAVRPFKFSTPRDYHNRHATRDTLTPSELMVVVLIFLAVVIFGAVASIAMDYAPLLALLGVA